MIRLLCVDDEPVMLDLTKIFLEEFNKDFQVETASSAEEALRRLKKKEYDAVVSDYAMPRMDGLEFLGELRRLIGQIPFIIFTGRGRREVADKAFQGGADGYVTKGGNPTSQYSVLASQIREAIDRRNGEEAPSHTQASELDDLLICNRA